MLPFATLLLVSVILAETTMPTPTGTAVVSNLLPPYAAGPAFYHASIVRTSGNDIVYAITCSDSQQGRDACLTASLGTESQTFTQGPGGWTVNRFEASTTFGFGEFYTLCAFSGSTNGASQTASPYTMSCSARDLLTSTGSDTTKLLVETRSSSGTKGIFGLQQQAVTITAGFEKAPDATWLQPTATGASFTDIGASRTDSAPTTTVTLHKINSGTRLWDRAHGVFACILSFAAVVIVM